MLNIVLPSRQWSTLFKYQYKGHDLVGAGLQIQDNEEEANEIRLFQTRQYVSACEASWHIYQYKMCKLQPSVVKLQVHLKDQQSVVHNPDINSARSALERNKKTQLTAYCKMNEQDEEANEYKYEEFPQYFTWKKK